MIAEKIFAVAQVADQFVLWLLILLSVVSIGVILERYFSLGKLARASASMRNKVKMALQAHAVSDVEHLSREVDTMEGRVLGYALRHVKDTGTAGLEEIFNTYILTEKPELEKNLSFLATIGSNAPYIGLFGTVLGIMKAFADLSQNSQAGQQTVMAGISMALVSTAAGLFVAIPAVIFYNFYQRKVKSILTNLDSVKELCMAYAKQKERK